MSSLRRHGRRRIFIIPVFVVLSTPFYRKFGVFQISLNVSAVGDVLPARIGALRSKDQGWQNVPEQRRGNERSGMT
jgi:hypothetical protein